MYHNKDTLSNLKHLLCLCFVYSLFIPSDSASECSHSKNTNKNFECPLWFHYHLSTNSCQCLPYYLISCDVHVKKAYVKDDYLLTSQKSHHLVSLAHYKNYFIPNKTKPGYKLLPENISDLNSNMCGPMNRKGYLCSNCIDGHGPSISVLIHPNDCYKCTDNWNGVILYLVIMLAPVTLFYLIMLVFQFRITSAPMPCFIMYSQFIVVLFSHTWNGWFHDIAVIMLNKIGNFRAVGRIILALYGIFSMDFVCHAVPPFCISTYLGLYHRAFLGFISAVYPMLLILITWICIKLHDHNFRMIQYLWRPFHRCFVRLRRGWNTKNDLIDVFATFILLSYTRTAWQCVLIVSSTTLYTYTLNGSRVRSYTKYVSDIDNTIDITNAKYITGFLFGLVIFITFNILPAFLLILYPIGKFRKMLSKVRLDRISLTIFMEKFHCCYRDGLDGKRDMRYFSGSYFVLSIAVLHVPRLLCRYFQCISRWFVRGTLFLIAAILISLFRPYKAMYANVCDTLLLCHSALIQFIISSTFNYNIININYYATLMQTLIICPFVILVFILCFKFIRKTYCTLFCKSRCQFFISCVKPDRNGLNCRPEEQKIIQSVNTYGAIN